MYDEHCSDVLSPLLNVQELRELGVTLHMQIGSSREQIEDVPAIYFVRPTDDAVACISKDLSKGLYDSYYINFSSPLDRKLLEKLASNYAEHCKGMTGTLRLYDQFLDYVSVEEDFFSLNLKNSYQQYFGQVGEDEITRAVTRTVEGIFSVFVAMGGVPVLQCPVGGAAEMVCSQLSKKIHQSLSNSKTSHLFNDDRDSSVSATKKRPVLLVLDRNIDMVQALHHTSTYQALVDDLFEVKLNRVSLPNPSGTSTSVTLDGRVDKFWEAQCGDLFPKVVEAAEAERKRLIDMEQEIKRKAQDAQGSSVGTSSLHDAVSNLEKYEEDKKKINSHYKVLEAIMEKVGDRNIPSFFEMEQQLSMSDSIQSKTIIKMLGAEQTGTVEDKVRLFSIWYLCTNVTDGDFANAKYTLKNSFEESSDTSLSLEKICDTLVRMKLVLKPYEKLGQVTSGRQDDSQLASAAAWATSMLKEGTKLVKKWIPNSDVDTKITRICGAVMKNREDDSALLKEGVKEICYFDPMVKPGKTTKPYGSDEVDEMVLFVIGGATYTEYHNVRQYASKLSPPKRVVMGSTETINGSNFLRQLNMC